MLIKVTKASDWEFEEYRELNSMVDLECLINEFKHSVVVNLPFFGDKEDLAITVYDDYLE